MKYSVSARDGLQESFWTAKSVDAVLPTEWHRVSIHLPQALVHPWMTDNNAYHANSTCCLVNKNVNNSLLVFAIGTTIVGLPHSTGSAHVDCARRELTVISLMIYLLV